jgi:hypothetical protein
MDKPKGPRPRRALNEYETAHQRDVREALERTQRMPGVWKRARLREAESIMFGLTELKPITEGKEPT